MSVLINSKQSYKISDGIYQTQFTSLTPWEGRGMGVGGGECQQNKKKNPFHLYFSVEPIY